MADDDDLQLSSHALAALLEFRSEEQERTAKFEALQRDAQDKFDKEQEIREKGMALFKEDWQLSQFWYNDATADLLARELLDGATEDTIVVIVSAPSVYAAMKKFEDSWPTKQIHLLEFDKRFEVLAADKYHFFDYNYPQQVPEELVQKADRILADPPFIEYECQVKTSQAVKRMLRSTSSRFITCTGERVKETLSHEAYKDLGLHQTTFLPEHANGLSNEFLCYSNYEGPSWSFAK
jgi:protein required for attachment to host cells